jgi:hypothetical protein
MVVAASAASMDTFQMEAAILADLIASIAFLMELAPPAHKLIFSMVTLVKVVEALLLIAWPVSVRAFAPNALLDIILLDMESITLVFYVVLFFLDADLVFHQLYA